MVTIQELKNLLNSPEKYTIVERAVIEQLSADIKQVQESLAERNQIQEIMADLQADLNRHTQP